jgi:hypothetical protein
MDLLGSTLSSRISPRIAEAFSVREDTVRLLRSDLKLQVVLRR